MCLQSFDLPAEKRKCRISEEPLLMAGGKHLKLSSLYPVQDSVVDHGRAPFPRQIFSSYIPVGWADNLLGHLLHLEAGLVQVSTWPECLDLSLHGMLLQCFLPEAHPAHNWICLSLWNFGQIFPLLLLSLYSSVPTHSYRSALGSLVYEVLWFNPTWQPHSCSLSGTTGGIGRVKVRELTGWDRQLSGCLGRLPDSCFQGFSERRCTNDLAFSWVTGLCILIMYDFVSLRK